MNKIYQGKTKIYAGHDPVKILEEIIREITSNFFNNYDEFIDKYPGQSASMYDIEVTVESKGKMLCKKNL